ncbi:MAG TPA: hypothetical protein VF574_08795 [Allosphingosinicella sp.]|jgi:hypothetical protein
MIEPRITDPPKVDAGMVRALVGSGGSATIQFSKAVYSPELLRRVNLLCAEFGDSLEVRFYAHYGSCFDASALAHLPDVRWLSVDCLTQIRNEDELGGLRSLTRLSLGVYELDRPAFLETLSGAQLRHLTLTETARRNLDLAPIAKWRELRTLYVEGHVRNIELVAGLPNLDSLTLRAMPKHQSLAFLADCAGLRSLTLVLGGRSLIEELAHPDLESLSVVRVRGLESIGSLHRFPSLRRLKIEDQLQIRCLDVSGGTGLHSLQLSNCKNLEEIRGLGNLGRLRELRVSRTKLDLDALVRREWPPSLETLGLYSGSQKWNDAARAILDSRGYRAFDHRP